MANFSKMIEEMQEMAQSANAAYAVFPAAGSQGAHFWQAQDTILDELEQFTSSWFKRRHAGTRAAIETSRQLAEEAAANPSAAIGVITDWQSQSMERLAEDMKNYMELMTHCAEAFASNEVEAIEETTETVKKVTKSAKSDPV